MNSLSCPIAATWPIENETVKATIQDWNCWAKNIDYFLLLCLVGHDCPHNLHCHYKECWTVCSCSSGQLAMWAYWCWSWEPMQWAESFFGGHYIPRINIMLLHPSGTFPCSEPCICSQHQWTKAEIKNLVQPIANCKILSQWGTEYIIYC